jgi:hypothetical protein
MKQFLSTFFIFTVIGFSPLVWGVENGETVSNSVSNLDKSEMKTTEICVVQLNEIANQGPQIAPVCPLMTGKFESLPNEILLLFMNPHLTIQDLMSLAKTSTRIRKMVQIVAGRMELNFNGMNIPDETFKALFKTDSVFRNVKKLNLVGAKFNHQLLQDLPLSLQELDISGFFLNDLDLSKLSQLKSNLKSLKVSAGVVSKKSVADIFNFSNLRSLSIDIFNMTGEWPEEGWKMPHLESFEANLNLNGKGALLKALPELRSLRVGTNGVGEDDIKQISQILTLKDLTIDTSLRNKRDLSLKEFESLSNLKDLQKLTLYNTSISIEAGSWLAQLTKLTELRLNSKELKISNLEFIKKLSLLRVLDLRDTQLSENDLAPIIIHNPNLKLILKR